MINLDLSKSRGQVNDSAPFAQQAISFVNQQVIDIGGIRLYNDSEVCFREHKRVGGVFELVDRRRLSDVFYKCFFEQTKYEILTLYI